MKTVKIKDIVVGEGQPKICVPLMSATMLEVIGEVQKLALSDADMVEWRLDWFDACKEADQIYMAALRIKMAIKEKPLLITFRSREEGGEKEIAAEEYKKLLMYICEKEMADMIDVELRWGEEIISEILTKAKEHGVICVGSYHNFTKTPSVEEMTDILCRMQTLGFDITKLAVMPNRERDVLNLLDASLKMKEELADRPFITMSMKKQGLMSRLCGEFFGSSVTFGAVGKTSAPGQIEVKDLKRILDLFHE